MATLYLVDDSYKCHDFTLDKDSILLCSQFCYRWSSAMFEIIIGTDGILRKLPLDIVSHTLCLLSRMAPHAGVGAIR